MLWQEQCTWIQSGFGTLSLCRCDCIETIVLTATKSSRKILCKACFGISAQAYDSENERTISSSACASRSSASLAVLRCSSKGSFLSLRPPPNLPGSGSPAVIVSFLCSHSTSQRAHLSQATGYPYDDITWRLDNREVAISGGAPLPDRDPVPELRGKSTSRDLGCVLKGSFRSLMMVV